MASRTPTAPTPDAVLRPVPLDETGFDAMIFEALLHL
jgi:hypothetical protein